MVLSQFVETLTESLQLPNHNNNSSAAAAAAAAAISRSAFHSPAGSTSASVGSNAQNLAGDSAIRAL
eukprot:14886223-Ditylum_brightwellii.AAC.2